ncbi:MAG: mechanosensitive ion channel domain-containing protein, partial [Planctomycetota bacterium]
TTFELSELEYDFELLPPDAQVKGGIMRQLNRSLSAEDRAQVDTEVSELLAERRSQFRALRDDYREYLDTLIETQTVERRLLRVTDAFKDFADERILWIRSSAALFKGDPDLARASVYWLITPGNWADMVADLGADAASHPVVHITALLLWLAIFGSQWYLRPKLGMIAGRLTRVSTDRMGYTFAALVITLLRASCFPLLFAFVGWRLMRAADPSDFGAAVASGLLRVSRAYFTCLLLYHLCCKDGVADAHFGWTDRTRHVLRSNVLWLAPLIVPIVFVIETFEHKTGDEGEDPIGRLAFILGMIIVSVFFALVLRPRSGVFARFLERHRDGWLYRLRYVWFSGLVLLPIGFALLASAGYYYTAIVFERRVAETFLSLLGILIVYGLVTRWLVLLRRRLVFSDARKRREAALEEARAGNTSEGPDHLPQVEDDLKLDIEEVDTQARQMVKFALVLVLYIGAILIWSDMFAAISVLDRFQLWPDFGLPEEQLILDTPTIAADTGAAATSPGEAPSVAADEASTQAPSIPGPAGALLATDMTTPADALDDGSAVTLEDVLVAVFIIIVTLVISRNLPGMLEITVLQRLPLAAGERYATTTVLRYTVMILGIGLAFNAIGIGWSKVQWLAAAISLGIGFGLQEIVANFISGLIILFEQPVRVGDTVTVGTVSGSVTRIRMRATTVMDWDRKELIIPNKQFVTGEVINWTLTEATLRVRIPVGLAYGTDIDRAKRTMLHTAVASERVLRDPAPQAIVTEFGDDAIRMELRVFIPSIDHLLAVKDELHAALDKAFKEQGITIASPRRDLHLRSVPAETPEIVQPDEPEFERAD